MMNHDKNRWSLRRICSDPKEYSYLEAIITQNYPVLTDLYHFMQAKSPKFPFIPYYTLRKEFFVPAVTQLGYSMELHTFDTIVREADYNMKEKPDFHQGLINRLEFIEFCVLVSRFLFTTKLEVDLDAPKGRYYGVSIPRALELFINQSCIPFLDERKVEW